MTSKQLRDSILQAAIQGKLVPQEPSDTPAALLLERIQAERERLIEERKIRRDKNASVIYRTDEGSYYERNLASGEETCIDDEIPFDIPDSWQWSRVSSVFQLNPKVIADDNISAGFVPMEAISPGYKSEFRYYERKWEQIKAGYTVFADNDIAFAKITPCFQNRKAVVFQGLPNGIGAGTTELKVLRPYGETMHRFFVLYFLESPYFVEEATFKGTANQQRITVGYLENKLFPIPPLEEQERIVARIEELMTLVDQYEQAKVALDELESTLPDMLQQSILQAAIQGQLVPQEPSDTPAALLLERIQAERERLIKEKKIRRDKNASVIYRTDEGSYYERILTSGKETCIDDEIPFDIPDGWQWTRLEQILQIIMGQSPDGTSISEDESGMEFHQGKISFGDKIIRKSAYFTTAPKKVAPKNSVLLCVRAPVGLINITDRELCIGRGLCALVPMVGSPLFYFWLFHPLIPEFNAKATGSTFKAISLEVVKKQLFPIPPLEEQERIVARIEELMRYTDRLKSFTTLD